MSILTLEGKTAIVTGAARGIGRAIATQLAGAGASVMMNDLEEAALYQAVGDLSRAGHAAHGLAGDLTAPSFPDALIDATLRRFGTVAILVNNAGYSWDNVIQKTSDEQFQAMLDIHLIVPFRMLRAAATFIRTQAKKETSLSDYVTGEVLIWRLPLLVAAIL
jgi:3-oxoacyl-[acyl-carrier protein] reductase